MNGDLPKSGPVGQCSLRAAHSACLLPARASGQQVQTDLHHDEGKGGWWMMFLPHEHVANRWAIAGKLERLIATYSARIHEEFPGHRKGTFPMGWGIANNSYGDTWTLTKS